MVFQPMPEDILSVDNVNYRIAEHPLTPGMPYGQEGRRAAIYQLMSDDGEKYALKVFKSRFRIPSMVSIAEKMEPYSLLKGMQACERTVLTGSRYPDLLSDHPDLTYSVLMPWVEGPVWQEILLDPEGFSQELSLIR